ncbi:MAG: hypothetical protein LC789_08820 [Actinobacteria bacterium]|nr:hypothetical protein [Actinomycetota bacterium]
MRRAGAWAICALLLALTGARGLAAESPSPLMFRTYDGAAGEVVGRSTSNTYDYSRDKYPFLVRLTVPANAAPGAAQVYAAPFCGPPEEYPSSRILPVRITQGQLLLRVSPRRPEVGERLRVRVSGCDGTRGRLTVRVQVGSDSRDVTAPVIAGSASVRVRLAMAGTGNVSLPSAATQCRGSRAAAPVPISVRGPASSVAPSGSAVAPSPAASVAALPSTASLPASASASASPPSVGAAPTPRRSDHGLPVLPAAVAGLLLLGAGAAVLLRRARRG